ncbi:MAG: class I SAM-dependent methyltransferase [Nitrospirae bacterium]|nr:class I SAM-dependent methyltransferase [Nitrospirota bacterium]
MNTDKCILCGLGNLTDIEFSDGLTGVTSDCKPWTYFGCHALCSTCGHVQKRLNKRLLKDIETIYSNYELYSLSNGNEQLIFHQTINKPRSHELLTRLTADFEIPPKGRLLDVGCGNGALLKTFGAMYPLWSLFGFEKSNLQAKEVTGVKEIYAGSLDAIEGTYDLVTMIHVLEHVFDPVVFLKKLHTILKPTGILLVQVPFFKKNPFDLTVVDHCSHFQPDTLAYTLNAAGFKTVLQKSWIAKELGVVAVKTDNNNSATVVKHVKDSSFVKQSFLWLHTVLRHAMETSHLGTFGICGTAIAGTWLANMIGAQVRFFIDEDPLKQGQEHMKLPVFKPDCLPYKDAVVYLAFPAEDAKKIYKKLALTYPLINFIVPPNS